MAFLPVFLVGLFAGVVVTRLYVEHKKDVPSETKLHIQEAEIIRLKSDIENLEQLNEKLYTELDKLKAKKTRTKKVENK